MFRSSYGCMLRYHGPARVMCDVRDSCARQASASALGCVRAWVWFTVYLEFGHLDDTYIGCLMSLLLGARGGRAMEYRLRADDTGRRRWRMLWGILYGWGGRGPGPPGRGPQKPQKLSKAPG
jgi:hypothetical protein